MKFSRELLKRVSAGKASITEVLDEVRCAAPLEARRNREHRWWSEAGADLLETIAAFAGGTVFLSVQDAVREAYRQHGKVVVGYFLGDEIFRVMPLPRAEVETTERIVSQAMPAEMVDPPWDEDLPDLEHFRHLSERQYLRRLLDKHRWNLSAAAREAGVTRQALHVLAGRRELRRPA